MFPKSLSDIYGNSTSYTYGPGFIQFNGATWMDSRALLANVTKVRLCTVTHYVGRAQVCAFSRPALTLGQGDSDLYWISHRALLANVSGVGLGFSGTLSEFACRIVTRVR